MVQQRFTNAFWLLLLLVQTQKTRGDGIGKNGKVKRRYVRKVPRKLDTSTSAKKPVKSEHIATQDESKEGDAGGLHDGSEPKASQATKPTLGPDGEEQEGGDWKMLGDDVRYFPFREYNRKEKSLGLLCEKYVFLSVLVRAYSCDSPSHRSICASLSIASLNCIAATTCRRFA